jgi:GT2 family glycosyltransferase
MISVIICTYSRPNYVYILLKNLELQSYLPSSIILVATSKEDLGKQTNNQIDILRKNGISIKIFFSKKGLTRQRNVGVNNLPAGSSIVCFLDDDIIIPINYLKLVRKTFVQYPKAIGIGGVTFDNHRRRNNISRLNIIFKQDSLIPGQVLRSGINTGFDYSIKPYEVEWLPGCAMNYRVEAFRDFRFDERRKNTSWGEDVDFSMRIREIGKLYIFPVQDLIHTKSSINRNSNNEIRSLNLQSRLLLANDKLGRVRLHWIILAELLKYKQLSVPKVTMRFYFNRLKNKIKRIAIIFAYALKVPVRKITSITKVLISQLKIILEIFGLWRQIKNGKF